MMSKIERIRDKKRRGLNMRNIELPISFCSFFFELMVSVSKSAEDKMLFVTQFVFYQMVLFVPAANKGKVTHRKTPRVSFAYLVDFCIIVALVGVM